MLLLKWNQSNYFMQFHFSEAAILNAEMCSFDVLKIKYNKNSELFMIMMKNLIKSILAVFELAAWSRYKITNVGINNIKVNKFYNNLSVNFS